MKSFYGRRLSHSINKEQLSKIINSQFFINRNSHKNKLIKFKDKFKRLNLEIGFGLGENLIYQAIHNLDQGFIGCDPYLNGHLKVHDAIKENSLENIILSDETFSDLYPIIEIIRIYRIMILFPDPWPKSRHFKRRLVDEVFLKKILKLLTIDGKVSIATDHCSYLEEILYNFLKNNEFIYDLSVPFKSNPEMIGLAKTKYYNKAIRLGKTPVFIQFRNKKI